MIQVPWSSEMPRLPEMCGIETLAIVRSSTTMKLLSASTMPARNCRRVLNTGSGAGGALLTGSSSRSSARDVDLDFHRQPDPQRMGRDLLGIEFDPHR